MGKDSRVGKVTVSHTTDWHASRVRVDGLTGKGMFTREVELLGIADDWRACGRFDEAIRNELEERGIDNANRLKVESGLAYDTARAVIDNPSSMSHRVFLTLTTNLGIERERVRSFATFNSDSDAQSFDLAHENAKTNVMMLLGDFLQLDEERQQLAIKIVRAMRDNHNAGSKQHARACRRLDLQLDAIGGLKPEEVLVAVPDDEWSAPRTRWAGDTTATL